MARKIKKNTYEKAKTLENILRIVAEHEIVRDRGAEIFDTVTREEWIEEMDNFRLQVQEDLKQGDVLERFANEYVKPISGVQLFSLWENSIVTLPAINLGIFAKEIVMPYWQQLDYARNNPQEKSREWIAENSLMGFNIAYRTELFIYTLQKHEPEGVSTWTKKLLIHLLLFRRSIQRHKNFWKIEQDVEIEVEVEVQKKKKTVMKKEKKILKTQNYLDPRFMARLTKIENMLSEMIKSLPLFYVDDKITDKANKELQQFLNIKNLDDTRKAEEKQGRKKIDSEKLSQILDPIFLRDFINMFYIDDFLDNKFKLEMERWDMKKMSTVRKHLKAYTDMLLDEVIIMTEAEEERTKDFETRERNIWSGERIIRN